MPIFVSSAVHAHTVEPEHIVLLESKQGECGIKADYLLSGSILRVELAGQPSGRAGRVLARAYAPNAVTPPMRDIWLKSTTLFTLGSFRPAKENSQGILEMSGEVDRTLLAAVVREIADGDVEISLIFDGVLPASRLAVGLPSPLPADVAALLNDCAADLEKTKAP